MDNHKAFKIGCNLGWLTGYIFAKYGYDADLRGGLTHVGEDLENLVCGDKPANTCQTSGPSTDSKKWQPCQDLGEETIGGKRYYALRGPSGRIYYTDVVMAKLNGDSVQYRIGSELSQMPMDEANEMKRQLAVMARDCPHKWEGIGGCPVCLGFADKPTIKPPPLVRMSNAPNDYTRESYA